MRWLLLIIVLASLAHADQTLSVEWFDEADAVCQDGSRGGVYVAAAQTSSSQRDLFVLYLEGGGWCYDAATCHARCAMVGSACTSPLATSKTWTAHMRLGGLLSDDASESPLHSANKFFLRYCTSDAHMGARNASSESFGWHFQGQKTVAASLRLMVDKYGLGGRLNQTLLFGGGSAGGRGAMVNLDYVSTMLADFGIAHPVHIRGFLDSPYWIDASPDRAATPPSHFIGFNETTKAAVALANVTSRLWPECVEHFGGAENAWKCAFGEYRFPFLQTPYMVIASQNDAFQLSNNVGHRPTTAQELSYAATFASRTVAGLNALPGRASLRPSTVFYAMACYSHSTSLSASFARVTVNGISAASAVAQFLALVPPSAPFPLRLVDQCDSFACGPGC